MRSDMELSREAELWACALAIEREYGDGAFLHAALKIDRFEARGRRDAAKVWREVMKRIEALEPRERVSQ